SVCMSKDRTVHSALVDEINRLSCQIFQSVQINRLFIDHDLFPILLYIQNSLEQDPDSVLDELTHGVQVCCQVYGCREDTLLVFSFALTVELFPPLRYIVKARLIVCQNLYCLALAEQDVADRRILHCIVLCKIILKCS